MFEQQILGFITGPLSFILDPHPAMLLVCCLILGCSVSSFMYRRQEQRQISDTHLPIRHGSGHRLGIGIRNKLQSCYVGICSLGFVLCNGLQSYSALAAGEKVEAQEPICI